MFGVLDFVHQLLSTPSPFQWVCKVSACEMCFTGLVLCAILSVVNFDETIERLIEQECTPLWVIQPFIHPSGFGHKPMNLSIGL